MNITYKTKSVYGQDKRYPVSEDAHLVCNLTGKLTITDRELAILSAAGHTIQQVMGN